MSKFSGKADFFDHLWMSSETEEEAFNKFNGTELYIVQPVPEDVNIFDCVNIPETYYKKIEYTSMKDLIPYYPHTIAFGSWGKEHSIVCLSSKSHVDIEEEDRLNWYMRDLQKIYRRCKRKKIEFDVEAAVKEVDWHDYNTDIIRELAERVKKYGKKATSTEVHLPFYEQHYRQNLVAEMLAHGIDPAEWGLERFVK